AVRRSAGGSGCDRRGARRGSTDVWTLPGATINWILTGPVLMTCQSQSPASNHKIMGTIRRLVDSPLSKIRTARQFLFHAWMLYEAVQRCAITPAASAN